MNLPGFMERPVVVSVCSRTDTGRHRADNQDNFVVADLSAATPESAVLQRFGSSVDGAPGNDFLLGPRGALLLVADGMGGAAAGAMASQLAVAEITWALARRWGADPDESAARFVAHLREAVQTANAQIHDHAVRHPDRKGMGTTATAGGILGSCLYLAQVGDSRAYLVRGGRASQLTRDQSLVQNLIDAGAITEEQAEQSRHAGLILQALGTGPEVEVDVTYQQLRRGDRIILCSDGLSRVVRKEEIAAIAARAPDTLALCERLIELANSRGGPDNITVIAAIVDGAGLEEPQAGDVAGRREFESPLP